MKRKINLSEVTAKEPIKVDTEIQPSIMKLPEEEISSATPFKLHIEVYKEPIGYDVYGKMDGEVELTCSRCNRKFRERLKKEFHYKILPTSEISGGEIKASELDVKFSDSDILDLAEVVEEQILLNLPVKPLCDELCSIESFESRSEPKDKRWEKLKELKNKLEKEMRNGSSKEESFKNQKG